MDRYSEKTLNVTHQGYTQRVKRVGHLPHQNQEKVVTVLTNAVSSPPTKYSRGNAQ